MNSNRIIGDLTALQPFNVGEMIRLGGDADGAYVIPKMIISKTQLLVSMGISDNWSFDQDFVKLNPDIEIHAYDHTISKNIFLQRIFVVIVRMLLLQKGFKSLKNRVNTYRGYKKFFVKKVSHYKLKVAQAESRAATSIKQIFSRIEHENVFVKMDIEGAEYEVIDDLLKFDKRILAMAIEFHDTDKCRNIFIEKIKKINNSFVIAHIHGNNCADVATDSLPVSLEITFIRKDQTHADMLRIRKTPILGLDQPNDPSRPDYVLEF